MSKNKLMWNIALILMVITSLPIAYAQAFTGSSWFFIVVNSLIVGVVLFILQSFLMPGKEGKEKTAVWVAIIAGSLLIGFLFGRSGFIWATGPFSKFFNIYVLVNAFIIGIVAYFALGLLKVVDIQSPQGKTGYGILIFIGALVWAIGIANSYGNVFIWQAYSYFISYFIGPEGILNPYPPQYRLLVFAGSFVLLAFFFQNYLITGAGANKTVNYALALILAMNMASSGVSVRSVIILGEIIFVLVLQKALAGGPAQNKWVSWLFAICLVGWASAAMTYGTQYQGAIATPIGWIMSWLGLVQAGTAAQPTSLGWLMKTGLVVGALFLLFGGGLLIIGRGEDREGIFGKFRKRLTTRLSNELKTRTQKYIGQVGIVTRWDIPEGREPKSFVENRLLLQALLDYSLRLDIFNAKRFLFEKVKTDKISNLFQSLGRYVDRKQVRYEIAMYRSTLHGPQFAPIGWAHFDRTILEYTREYMQNAYEAIRLVNNPSPDLNQQITNIANSIKDRNSTLIRLAGAFKVAYENFEGRYTANGTWHQIRSIMLNIYDMYNVFGVYEHDYIFPRAEAKFRLDPYSVPTTQAAIAALPNAPQVVDIENPSDSDVEVNRFGYDVKMINNRITDNLAPSPRKLLDPARQSDFHLNLIILMKSLGNEWRAFTNDFRYGTYTPNSRVVKDYTDAMTQNIDVHLNDDAVVFNRQGGIAFDRRALGDPGLWKYWGRIHWYGDINDVVMNNPYPRLTVLGIQSYLYELIKARERDPERVINDFLNSYPLDLEKEIQTKEDIVQAIGKFREKKAA